MSRDRILIADDEEAIREVISTLLEAKGYECQIAPNGQAALDFFRQQSYSLVLSDILMPEMDGIKILVPVAGA